MSKDPPGTKRLPPPWTEYLSNQPETGMDYQTGDLLLRDGTWVRDVVIIGCSLIAEIRDTDTISLDPADIAEIQLTHRKWDWRR